MVLLACRRAIPRRFLAIRQRRWTCCQGMVPGSSWGESVTPVTVSTAAKLLMSWPGAVRGLCKLLTSGVERTAVVSVAWLQTTRLPLVVTRFDASPACALGTVRGTVVVAAFPPSELAAMRLPPSSAFSFLSRTLLGFRCYPRNERPSSRVCDVF